ncbi:MAG: 4Fe-4S ferredoxin [bacterium]|nr:4Fe-4S ferredoxin [bacterium]
MAKIIITDPDRCLGCKTCVTECALAHSEAETIYDGLIPGTSARPRVHVEPVGGPYGAIPMQCQHCQDAPCISVCPTEAISRESNNSPVLLNQDQCIACRLCMCVCPFGSIDLSDDGTAMIKCDLCIERTESGQEPACVAGCPTGAMKFEEVNDLVAQRRQQSAELVRTASTKKQ